MELPFTKEQFLEVFKNYNTAFFPFQFLLLLLAAYVVFLTLKGKRNRSKVIIIALASFWIWMGTAYHIAYFSAINRAAYLFGALSILQGMLLLVFIKMSPLFSFQDKTVAIFSIVLLSYALIIYPVIGFVNGPGYPYSPTFGLPCPTTIFTFAIFLLAQHRLPFYITIIPLFWSVVGFLAAFTLGIYEDNGLIISGLTFSIINFTKPKFSTKKRDYNHSPVL